MSGHTCEALLNTHLAMGWSICGKPGIPVARGTGEVVLCDEHRLAPACYVYPKPQHFAPPPEKAAVTSSPITPKE